MIANLRQQRYLDIKMPYRSKSKPSSSLWWHIAYHVGWEYSASPTAPRRYREWSKVVAVRARTRTCKCTKSKVWGGGETNRTVDLKYDPPNFLIWWIISNFCSRFSHFRFYDFYIYFQSHSSLRLPGSSSSSIRFVFFRLVYLNRAIRQSMRLCSSRDAEYSVS